MVNSALVKAISAAAIAGTVVYLWCVESDDSDGPDFIPPKPADPPPTDPQVEKEVPSEQLA